MVFGSPIPNRNQTYSLKDFSYPKSSTCSANLNSGVFGKLNLENTFWPNYFCKKILYCTIHMVWSLGRSFGSRKWSIEGEAMLTFKRTWKHREKTNSNKKPNNAKVFVKQQFIMIYHLKCCAMKIRVCQYVCVWISFAMNYNV